MLPFPYLRDAVGTFFIKLSWRFDWPGVRAVYGALNGFGHSILAHDRLTGVLTRREFHGRVEAEWQELHNAAALLFDVDLWAYLNYALGHDGGDRCLVAMAGFFADEAEGAWVCRWGGDKFAVVVKNAAQAERIANRIRARMEHSFLDERVATIAMHSEIADGPLLTFSVGAAKVVPSLSLVQVLERCEEALYAAKQAGRNRLCWTRHDSA